MRGISRSLQQASPRAPVSAELTGVEALIIVGIISAALIALIFLWFLCVFGIDVCILGIPPSNPLRRGRETLLWWRRDDNNRDSNVVDEEGISGSTRNRPVNSSFPSIPTFLNGLAANERNAILEFILPGKPVTTEQISEWTDMNSHQPETAFAEPRLKEADHFSENNANSNGDEEMNETSSEHGIICAICLSGIVVGDIYVAEKTCSHLFHRECLLEWLEKSPACPYCRILMVTEDDISEAIANFGLDSLHRQA